MNTLNQAIPEEFLRHTVLRRLEHWAVTLIFIVLAVTGLAQRYYQSDWALWVITHLGGIDGTRLIHRYCGFAFTVLMVVHMGMAVMGVLWLKWRPSMLISRKDFTDVAQNMRYYLRLSDDPARCDRYDYRAKFEYWGIVLGGFLMVGSGLVLWFPVWFFRTFSFLPAETIPAAKTIHSNEAMLALTVLVVWHVYNSFFSPEVFPMDRCMFHGRISKERMVHEHPLEYERITGEPAGHDHEAGTTPSETGAGPSAK